MSGMRPTGRLHLGNYWGALKNWVTLQDGYQCYFSVVDWHMFTTGYEDTSRLPDDIREMVYDWLAAGLDPKKAVIFRQSHVPQHAELALLLSMITPLSWLENNPTWKEQLQELAKTKESKLREELAGQAARQAVQTPPAEAAQGEEKLRTHGFLGYPVLQAADILIYQTDVVPIGQDQLPHLELAREIARRFNTLYASGERPVFKEPRPLLTPTPRVLGIDGRKMSKSYGNAIDLYETPESLRTKVMSMYTDPKKIRGNDPGHPEPCPENPPGCTVFALHKLYTPHWERREKECRGGEIGCVACKKDLLNFLEPAYDRFRKAREKFAKDPSFVDQLLSDGAAQAAKTAEQTMERVRSAMRLA